MHLGIGMRMQQSLKLCHELTLRLKLEVPGPEEASTGIVGLKLAHECLIRLGAPGILIGGVARKAWTAVNCKPINSRKDVDVLVLSNDTRKHPSRFEAGIDWWLPTEDGDAIWNGNHCRLIYRVWMRHPLDSGLYITPHALLWAWRIEELAFFGLHRQVNETSTPRLRMQPLLDYPVAPYKSLGWRFTPRDTWEVYGSR